MKWSKAAAGVLAGIMVMGFAVSAEEAESTGNVVEISAVTAVAEDTGRRAGSDRSDAGVSGRDRGGSGHGFQL